MKYNNEQKIPNKYKGYLLLAALVFLGIVLLVLPANYFDTGRPWCISVLLLNKECYGCGMTRAVQHLIHLDFDAAWDFNKLSFIVFPLLVYMILWETRKRYFIGDEHDKID